MAFGSTGRTPGVGELVGVDTISGVDYQLAKILLGAQGVLGDSLAQADPAGASVTSGVAAFAQMLRASGNVFRPRAAADLLADAETGSLFPGVAPMVYDRASGQFKRASSGGRDGETPTFLRGTIPMLFNDGDSLAYRQRPNTEIAVLASGSRNGTASSATFTNNNHRGVSLRVNVSVQGAGTMTVAIQTVGGYQVASWAGLSGTVLLTTYPGPAQAAGQGGTLSLAAPLPRTWQVVVTTTAAWTYSIDAHMLV